MNRYMAMGFVISIRTHFTEFKVHLQRLTLNTLELGLNKSPIDKLWLGLYTVY